MTRHTKTIDEMIDEAVRAKKLTALTLWPAGDGWQANARFDRGGGNGWNCCTDKDAANGVRRALGGEPWTQPENEGGIFG